VKLCLVAEKLFLQCRKKVIFQKEQQFSKGKIMYGKLNKYTGVDAKIIFLNLLVLTILFLSGCAMKFPVPDETNQTILIIPVETRQTLRHFVFTLDVSIKGSSGNEGIKHKVEPNPKMLYSYNTQLKPGKYKITKMVMKAKPGFKLGGGVKQRRQRMKNKIEFELQKGRITIIDKMILFQQPEAIKGKTKMRGMDAAEREHEKISRKKKRETRKKELREKKFRSIEIVDLDESFKTKILEELKEVENIDQWKLE